MSAASGCSSTPDGGFGFDDLLHVVGARLAFVPRYRQRIRWVPGNLANPVWVDDEDFDLTYHVRRSALPRPGTQDQLRELVARIMSRPLDRSRPLWEMYLVEGLDEGRFALLSKTHQAVVDGVSAVDIGQVVLDASPQSPEAPTESWLPSIEPSSLELLAGAMVDVVRRPGDVVESARRAVSDLPVAGGWAVRTLGGAVGSVVTAMRTAARPAPEARSTCRSVHSAGSRRSTPGSTTTARSGPATAETSTTSCWRPSPARSGPGCSRGASASPPRRRCARSFR